MCSYGSYKQSYIASLIVSCFQSAQKGQKLWPRREWHILVIFLENVPIIIEHKFNLLLKIIFENKQVVQLFTKTIKTESIYKSNYDANLEGLVGERPNGLIKRERKRKHFKRKCRKHKCFKSWG